MLEQCPDVEATEEQVLRGWRSAAVQPWILIIESTRPLTQDPSYQDWEALVLKKGYTFAYFDGLKRFYVAPDKKELLAHFTVGPNVFDGFNLSRTTPYCYWLVQNFDSQLATEVEKTRFSEQALESCRNEFNAFRVTVNAKLDELNQSSQHWYRATQAAEHDVKNLQDEVTSLKGEIIGLQSHIDESQVVMEKLKTELAQILSSTSWRITAPLRAFNCGRLALLHWMKYSIFRVAK